MPEVPIRKPVSGLKVPIKKPPVPVKLPLSVSPGGEFEERLIHVIRMDSGTDTIKAKCLGTLAVHPGLIKDGGWAVTHMHIQLALVHLSSEQDAMRVARYLWVNCRSMVEQKSINNILDKTPKWISPWCRAMQEQRKWLDPKVFKELK